MSAGNQITMKGMDNQVRRHDGSTDWFPMEKLKDSNPVELAECAISAQLSDEPVFKWRPPPVSENGDCIIKRMKSGDWSKTQHESRIGLPRTVEHALEIDRETATTFWKEAIGKEMKAATDCTFMLYDSVPELDSSRPKDEADWTDYYGDVKEVTSNNALEACGKAASTSVLHDASYAGSQVMQWSWMDVLTLVNQMPMLWLGNTRVHVESSTYSSELAAARNAVGTVEGLCYELRMMGIPIDCPTNMSCDNQGVVRSVSSPESALRTRRASTAWHRLHVAQATCSIKLCQRPTDSNPSDLLTKMLSGPILKEMVSRVLW